MTSNFAWLLDLFRNLNQPKQAGRIIDSYFVILVCAWSESMERDC